MNRQHGFGHVHGVAGRGSLWFTLIAAAATGLLAAPASAQRARDDNKNGPGVAAPPARSAPAPRAQAPSRPAPIIRETPRAAPPSSAPVIRPAPRPTAPPAAAPQPRSAPPVTIAPPARQPVAIPRPAPPQTARRFESPMAPVPISPPTKASPPVVMASPKAPPIAAPPKLNPPVVVNPPHAVPSQPKGPVVAGPRPPVLGGSGVKPIDAYTPPKPAKPIKMAPPLSGPKGATPTTVSPPVITKAPEGFDKPLTSKPRSSWPTSKPVEQPGKKWIDPVAGGLVPSDRSPRNPVISAAAPKDVVFAGARTRGAVSTTSVFVGIGVGSGYGAWKCPPAPSYTGCFDPCTYAYSDPFCYTPCYYNNPYWARDTWGCSYVRSWNYWPSWWWYPTYYARAYPCGTFSYVGYGYGRYNWSFGFSFAYAPAWGYTSCGLISPSVYAVYEPAPTVYTVLGAPSVSVLAPAEEQPTIIASSTSLPAPATSEQLRVTTDRELADVYLRLGDTANAIRVYTDHLARFPGDVEAQRSLGVALIEADRVAEGVEQIERAYLIDPTLAQRPWSRDLLADPIRLARALDTATRQAATDGSSRAWLTVTMLMQADGRTGPARAALDKARAAGLNAKIVEWMQAALPAGEQ